MGASGWSYWVPYREDIEAALHQLREDVFRRGEFFRRGPDVPSSLEQALERGGESGTHSILDVVMVSDRPDYGAVAPLPADDVRSLFGNERPTRADIEAAWAGVVAAMQRRGAWVGSYVVVYRGDQPDELLFFGMSGD